MSHSNRNLDHFLERFLNEAAQKRRARLRRRLRDAQPLRPHPVPPAGTGENFYPDSLCRQNIDPLV